MTHPRMSLLCLPALLGALAGCSTPPLERGGVKPLAAQAAAAQHPGPGWLLLGSNEEGSVYMHPRSTLRVGSSAFIMLVGSKREPAVLPDGVSVGSVREGIEIDCDKQRFRRHDGTAHPDQVALGPVLGQVGQQEQWKGVRPGTVMDLVASAVCSATAPNTGGPGNHPEPAMPRLPKARTGTFRT